MSSKPVHKTKPHKKSAKKAVNHNPKKSAAYKNNNRATKSKTLCPVEKACGACQHLSEDYPKQLQRKQQFIVELFEDIVSEETILDPILGMEDPFYYRNKVVSPYAPGKRIKPSRNQPKRRKEPLPYEVLCGMYKQGTHQIIATDSCLLENKQAKQIILTIRNLISQFAIDAYNEDTGEGLLRHAVVRVGHNSGEILVTLVTNQRTFPRSKAFVKELVKRCPYITSVVQNINTRPTNVIMGENELTLYGPGFILDTLCGLSFRISSHSFYQVNSTQTEVLYHKAIELAELSGAETVLDAYCGTGTIGLVAASGIEGKNAKRVIGVDNVEEAIIDARNNALHNNIKNAEFFAEDASAFMTRFAQDKSGIDVLLMDPPRAGSNVEFLSATCSMAPKRIVYISCNPKTQVRDCEYLIKHGYTIQRIQAVDMFPHTDHVECIALLSKVEE